MTDSILTLEMCELGKVTDFLILYKNECHSDFYGLYYPNHKVAVIYLKDEEGHQISNYQLKKTAIHELTHHLLYHYSKWENKGNEHDYAFKELFNALLKKYYNYDIPQGVLDLLKEEEMYEERGFTDSTRKGTN